MCDKEPKNTLKPPFSADSGLNALAQITHNVNDKFTIWNNNCKDFEVHSE